MDKLKIQLGICVASIALGGTLLIVGITVPPVGVIDNSVLIAFGEICTFVGALIGIDYKYKS